MVRRIVNRLLRVTGYKLARLREPPEEAVGPIDETTRRILTAVQPFTMTSAQRLVGLIDAVRYLVRNQIAGDIAECGVWRGGSMMAIALTLLAEGDTSRRLYLYDTFEGMSEPTSRDASYDGRAAAAQLRQAAKVSRSVWCIAGLDDVRANVASAGYPGNQIHFVRGKVEQTIPQTLPDRLALLRLDTDWYESTKHELQHLYPRLVTDGVLIIDDYGHWSGAKDAVDEFFRHSRHPLLQRMDYTGRLMLKRE